MQTTEEQLTDVGFFPPFTFQAPSSAPSLLQLAPAADSNGLPATCRWSFVLHTQRATTAGLWVSVSMKLMQIYRGAVKKDDK